MSELVYTMGALEKVLHETQKWQEEFPDRNTEFAISIYQDALVKFKDLYYKNKRNKRA